MTNPATGQPMTWGGLLSLVPVLALALAMVQGWTSLRSDLADKARALTDLERRVAAYEAGAQDREVRIRALETGFGRMEERLVRIDEGIIRIERAIRSSP